MEETKAKEILGYEWESLGDISLQERFDVFRELYCPKYYELLSGRDERNIKQEMYKKICTEEEEKDACCNRYVETEAFLRFADVHDAYNTLAENKEYKEHSLDYDNIKEYETKRFGEKVAKRNHIAQSIASFGIILMIVWVASFVLGCIFNNTTFGDIVQVIFYCTGHCVLLTRIADAVYAPRQHFLYIPLSVRDDISKEWDTRDSIISNIFGSIFIFAFSLVISVVLFIINPASGTQLKEDGYRKRDDYKEFCREIVNARYERTLRDIESYINQNGGEKYLNSKKAVAYYMHTYRGIPSDVITQGYAMICKGSIYSAAFKEINKQKDEAAKERERREESAWNDAARAERKADRRLSNGYRYNPNTDRYEEIYSQSDHDDDVQNAYDQVWDSIELAEKFEKETLKLLDYEKKLLEKRASVAAATACYSAKLEKN